jgi:proline racemase
VTARMARDYARGLIMAERERTFYGPTGIPFQASVIASTDGPVAAAVTVRVSGTSAFSGRSTFVIEKDDPLGHGFALPLSYNDLLLPAAAIRARADALQQCCG